MSTYDWYANLEVGAEVMTLNLSETERPVIHVTITKKKGIAFLREIGSYREGKRTSIFESLGEADFLSRPTIGEKNNSL